MNRVKQENQDDMYSLMLEELDPEKANKIRELEEKFKYKAPPTDIIQIEQDGKFEGQNANMKVFFAVEKLQITMQDEVFESQKQGGSESVVNILLIHFGIEVEIDRSSNTSLNMSIYKFLIEDIQKDVKIALPFRMILSSPMNNHTRQSFASGSESSERVSLAGSVLQRSLINLQLTEQDQDDFKDALDDEQEVASSLNEWELKLKIVKNHIDIDCIISDLRFVFAVPTAKKMAQIGIRVFEILESVEKDKLSERKVKLEMYEYVLARLSVAFESEEQNLMQKIFINQARANGLDPLLGQLIYQESIQRLYHLYDIDQNTQSQKDAVLKIESEKTKQSMLLEHIKKHNDQLYEKIQEVKQKISVKAVLKNLSIWIPLDARSDQTQVLSLSLMSDLRFNSDALSKNTFEATLNELIKKDPIQSSDQLVFSISHFMVEMINSDNYLELMQNRGSSSSFRHSSKKLQTLQMITPCRFSLQMNNFRVAQDLTERSDISLTVEPLEIKVGFKHIDFLNMVAVEVQSTLEFVQEMLSENKRTSFKQEVIQARVSQLKEEVKKKEEAVFSLNIGRQQIKPYRRDNKFKSKITSIKLDVESIAISLNEDAENIDRPLFQLFIKNANVNLKQFEKEDDAGTFILKKMGIYQKRNSKQIINEMNKDITAFAMVNANYYNQRSLAFEPLIEQYYILASLQQLTSYTDMKIKLQSEKLLYVNLTFGMALTLRKIMDRIQESVKGAQIVQKLTLSQQVTPDELSIAKQWQAQLNKQRYNDDDDNNKINQVVTYVFQNFTGLALRGEVHDSMRNDILREKEKDPYSKAQINESALKIKDLSFQLSNSIHNAETVSISYDELMKQHQEITMRKNKGQVIELVEDEPLKMDFQLEGFEKLEGIPIETLGVHSYRTNLKLTGKGASQLTSDRSIGIVISIKMDGNQKKLTLESQVLLVNSLNRPIEVFVQDHTIKNYYPKENERTIIEPEQVFRIPLTWIYGSKHNSLYIEAKAAQYMLFQNLEEIFSENGNISKLNSNHSQLIRLQHDYFASLDIQSFKCLPKAIENGPPQYLVSFNPPVMISNYNFQPLELKDNTNGGDVLIALMGPKESGYINQIDGFKNKPNLQWTYFEDTSNTLTLQTNSFNVVDRLESQTEFEKFTNNSKNKRDLRTVKLIMEVRKSHYLNIQSYQENFELRQRSVHSYTSAVQVMLYPKYMIINKTSLPIICEKQTVMPYTNEYFMHSREKVSFKVPGFGNSQSTDITTIGLSGSISLDLQEKLDVMIDKLPQKDYIPQKLELGVIISSAPTPFNKTILISIVPRFLFVNQLGVPLVIKQKSHKNQVLLQGQQLPYNFEQKNIRQIMVRQASKDEVFQASKSKKLYADLAQDESFWSSPFSIDDLDDFQVSYPGQEMKEDQVHWYNPSPDNNYQRFVRVIVTTQSDATILVVFANPVFPEYEIVNKTDTPIEIGQLQETSILNGLQTLKKHLMPEEMIVGKFQQLKQKVTVPYVWNDRSYAGRLFGIRIGNTLKEINIDKEMPKTQFQTASQMKYNIEVSVSGNAKRIKITNINQGKESFKQALFLQTLLKRFMMQSLNLGIELKGIGLSFIDDKPQELLFFSLYNLRLEIQRWSEPRQDGTGAMENLTKLKLHLQHLQLDNMATQVMPVLLSPTKPLNRGGEKIDGKQKPMREIEESKEEFKQGDPRAFQVTSSNEGQQDVPFIQLIITIAESQIVKTQEKVVRLRALQLSIQEFLFQAETSILNSNLKFVVELIQTFTDKKKYSVILADSESFERAKLFSREQVCSALNAKDSLVKDEQSIQANKMFIELIHLGAIKAIITFKLEKKAVEIDIFDPTRGFGILNLFYSVLANVASISNSNLSFSELVMTDLFVSQDVLMNTLVKNYSRQAIMQFYKLIGSSDIIGNPVGLVNKLGTGVYEFVSEPTKGLLKGPDEFVGGVGKGVQSLVSNVVSGGFESVGKITGSLYNVVKNVGGEKKQDIKAPDHVIDGVYQGVKGGVSELFSGVTGIFTKPIKSSQKDGARGFVKGLGQGLFGAITAPVTATLRAGTSVAQGVASTATTLGNIGKDAVDTGSIYARFRPPRYITSKNVITEFNEELAAVSTIVLNISGGKFASHSIKYYAYLPECNYKGEIQGYDQAATLVIVTDHKLLYVKIDKDGCNKGKPTILFKINVRKIKSCELYLSSAGNMRMAPTFTLIVSCYAVMKGLYKYSFTTISVYTKLEKLYNILSILPQVEAEDKLKGTKSRASIILEKCL